MQTELEKSPISEEALDDYVSLSPNHQRFVNLYMSGQYSLEKIAQLMNVHINTIRNWIKREDVKSVIDALVSDQYTTVALQLKAMSSKAARRMNELMDSPIDGVALQAIKDVLDRAGHKPKQEIKKDVTITTYEQQISDIISSTMGEDYIDVESEEY